MPKPETPPEVAEPDPDLPSRGDRRREMIKDLRRIAARAETLDSAAGLATARAALMNCVSLEGLEAPELEPPRPMISFPRPLTEEEWAARVPGWRAASAAAAEAAAAALTDEDDD